MNPAGSGRLGEKVMTCLSAAPTGAKFFPIAPSAGPEMQCRLQATIAKPVLTSTWHASESGQRVCSWRSRVSCLRLRSGSDQRLEVFDACRKQCMVQVGFSRELGEVGASDDSKNNCISDSGAPIHSDAPCASCRMPHATCSTHQVDGRCSTVPSPGPTPSCRSTMPFSVPGGR